MKGITTIISIIILLLLTVGLAATAWTYMSNYLTGIIAKNIEISTQKCVSGAAGKDAMAIAHNMGTSNITIANDVTILNEQGNVVSGASWTTIQGGSINVIEPGRYGKVNIPCCSGATCPKTCTFDMVIGGRTQTITIYCP